MNGLRSVVPMFFLLGRLYHGVSDTDAWSNEDIICSHNLEVESKLNTDLHSHGRSFQWTSKVSSQTRSITYWHTILVSHSLISLADGAQGIWALVICTNLATLGTWITPFGTSVHLALEHSLKETRPFPHLARFLYNEPVKSQAITSRLHRDAFEFPIGHGI